MVAGRKIKHITNAKAVIFNKRLRNEKIIVQLSTNEFKKSVKLYTRLKSVSIYCFYNQTCFSCNIYQAITLIIVHYILIKPIFSDHLSYMTLFQYNLEMTHKSGLAVYKNI